MIHMAGTHMPFKMSLWTFFQTTQFGKIICKSALGLFHWAN